MAGHGHSIAGCAEFPKSTLLKQSSPPWPLRYRRRGWLLVPVDFQCAATTFDRSAKSNFIVGPLRCPHDPSFLDPVVRFAGEAPVADRRPQRDSLAVVSQAPVLRRQRSDGLLSASTAAKVERYGILQTNVEHPRLQDGRRLGHETMLKPGQFQQIPR